MSPLITLRCCLPQSAVSASLNFFVVLSQKDRLRPARSLWIGTEYLPPVPLLQTIEWRTCFLLETLCPSCLLVEPLILLPRTTASAVCCDCVVSDEPFVLFCVFWRWPIGRGSFWWRQRLAFELEHLARSLLLWMSLPSENYRNVYCSLASHQFIGHLTRSR